MAPVEPNGAKGAPPARLAAWATFLVCGALFVWRAAPGVSFGDSGELAAATVCLGVPHPPGYPLQMLVGHAWWRALSPLALDPARALALLSAVCGAGAAAFLSRLAASSGAGFGAALAAGLLPALAPTFAAQCEIVEVYALAALLQAALLFTALAPGAARPVRCWVLFGLALAAHPASIALAPLPVLALLRARRERGSDRGLGLALPLAGLVAGLAVFAYVPLRAAADPPVNWGDATGGARLADHLLRTQYATGLDRAWAAQLGFLAEQLAGQWPLLFAVLAVGLVAARRELPRGPVGPLLATAGFAALLLLLAVNWPLADPLSRERLAGSYVPLVLAVSALGGSALVALDRVLANRLPGGARLALWPVAVLALALPFGPRTLAGEVDQRGRDAAERYAREVLEACPKDTVLVVSKLGFGDDLAFPLVYLQVAREARPDVLVLSRDLLPHPWFREQLARREPWLAPAVDELEHLLGLPGNASTAPRERRILTASFFPGLYAAAEGIRPVAFVARPSGRLLAGRSATAGGALWHLGDTVPVEDRGRAFGWLTEADRGPVVELLRELAAERRRARER